MTTSVELQCTPAAAQRPECDRSKQLNAISAASSGFEVYPAQTTSRTDQRVLATSLNVIGAGKAAEGHKSS